MRRLLFLNALLTLFIFGTTEAGAAKAPIEPSNLRVKPLGVNSFRLDWKDNSNNEVGWEIRVALKGTAPQRFAIVPTANITSYTIITNELPGKDLVFQMTAYNLVKGKEKLSKPTSIVTAKALAKTTFGAPAKLKAKTLDDGRIQLIWKDNATSESGYQMDIKTGSSKEWVALGNVNPGTSFKIPVTGVSPATKYSFRVRGYKSNPVKFTSYSNVSAARTKAFQAPSNLTAVAESDGAFSFKWKDKSSIETGYQLQYKTGTAEFRALDPYAANSTSTIPITGGDLNSTYQFRIRALRLVGTETVYSPFSNTISMKSTTLAKPTNVAAAATSDTSVTVTWKDASAREGGYVVQYREVGAATLLEAEAAANAQTLTITKLLPGKLYEFHVRALTKDFFGNRTALSAATSVQFRPKDGIAGDLNPPIFWNTSFVHQVEVSRLSELTALNVTGLPSDLAYAADTRTISGTTLQEGVRTVNLSASFKDGTTVNRSLILRIVRPPAAPVNAAAFTPVEVAATANSVVSLTGKFSDPDTPSAARVATTKGNFDIILYSLATPQTVTNFLNYVDNNRYDASFFHRSINKPLKNLVMLQGGGFKYTSAAGFTQVTKFAAVQNEPGVSNLKGTVAMAKLEDSPNSATSEFFVNIDDVNATNLDEQNGGFTAFGRVSNPGMEVIEAIHDLPTKAYSPTGLGSSNFTDVPMDAADAPAVLEPDKLVKINSVTAAPILIYEVLSLDPAIATASLAGTDITITGVATGSTTVRVKATDLDGQSITQDIAVTVP